MVLDLANAFVCVCRAPYLDVAGLLHKSSSILCSSVAFRELDPEELESPFKISLQEVLFGCLEQDTRRWEERGGDGGDRTNKGCHS